MFLGQFEAREPESGPFRWHGLCLCARTEAAAMGYKFGALASTTERDSGTQTQPRPLEGLIQHDITGGGGPGPTHRRCFDLGALLAAPCRQPPLPANAPDSPASTSRLEGHNGCPSANHIPE